VEFRTHFHNHPSRNAILRLGAKQDGILRNHRVDEHGNMRDTVVYSILNTEWKTVKTALEFKMGRSYLG
ncbi:MAG: GNAT family N-acetyltransferase, partial [Muricauda sp.]|nr:GNAT family N-acetyltransferase [Allomuricauda sp.]